MQMIFINNVGGMEIILILVFVLMFFGSKSIPGLAKTLGKGMREIQHASDEIKREIQTTSNNIKSDLQLGDQVQQVIQNIEKEPKRLLDQIETEVIQTKQNLENHINSATEVKKEENSNPHNKDKA